MQGSYTNFLFCFLCVGGTVEVQKKNIITLIIRNLYKGYTPGQSNVKHNPLVNLSKVILLPLNT